MLSDGRMKAPLRSTRRILPHGVRSRRISFRVRPGGGGGGGGGGGYCRGLCVRAKMGNRAHRECRLSGLSLVQHHEIPAKRGRKFGNQTRSPDREGGVSRYDALIRQRPRSPRFGCGSSASGGPNMAMKNPVHPGRHCAPGLPENPWVCRSPRGQRGLASGAKRFPTS